MKPYSESCEQNQEPIFAAIEPYFRDRKRVLEIGSGTGQHAVFFAPRMPHLLWQTSDLAENHAGIRAWLKDGAPNALSPLELNVSEDQWPKEKFDAVFSANAIHIMSWENVEAMFRGIAAVLMPGGLLCLYGPFNYGGKYTSESNAHFDQMLKMRDPKSGVRDFEAVNELAANASLSLLEDIAMPANNRTLVWKRRE